MKLYGLTGGIGMGKSAAHRMLIERGVSVIDTDDLAHQLVEPGQPALEEIAQRFGREVIAPDGRLRRDELARQVFTDPQTRKDLENILHPRIRTVWQAAADQWRNDGKACGVVIIPLLYETDAVASFDAVICIACSAITQRERLKSRGWNEQQIDQRITAQMSAEKKMELADFVIWTEGGVDIHAAQWNRILS